MSLDCSDVRLHVIKLVDFERFFDAIEQIIAEPPIPPLDSLIARLSMEIAGYKQANRAGLAHAIRAGEIIVEIKALAGHGGFLDALARCKINDRTARRWKRLYEARARIPSGIESESEAETWLAEDDAKSRSAGTGQSEKRPQEKGEQGSLERKFGIPPFTRFDASGGPMMRRKERLRLIGIKDAAETREATDIYCLGDRMDDPQHYFASKAGPSGGTSQFNPAIAEVLTRWFSPTNGLVLDPFSGGSVRGLVAVECGREYFGIDIRPEQIEANERDADKHVSPGAPRPVWVCGDSIAVLPSAPLADFVMSCPPYGAIEGYSKHSNDISAMAWNEFKIAYAEIIALAAARLKDDRFAAFVVGNFRDGKQGFLRDLVGYTTECFERAGLRLYNDGVLLTPLGTTPIRSARHFRPTRKLGRAHQSVLVYCKGDPRKAAEACEPLGLGDFDPACEAEGTPVQVLFDFGAEDGADE
jgi:hypothetical protein